MMFQGAREQMVTLVGCVRSVEKEMDQIRDIYLSKAPRSFWVDFGDFRWFKMDHLYNVRYIPDIQNAARNVLHSYLKETSFV